MQQALLNNTWLVPLVWSLLAFFGTAGLLALVRPAWFSKLSTRSSAWVDSNRLLAVFDSRFDIDKYVLPHSRIFGVCVLAAVGVFVALFWKFLAR